MEKVISRLRVEEASGGKLLIDIQAGGVLGSEDQILDNLLGGGNITDITRISAFALTQYGCEKASLLGISYTFVSEEHFWNFAGSDLAQEILLEPHEIGLPLRGLCYGEEGFRHFFFKDEVSGLEDLKGLKIRVSSDPIMTGMVGNLGASATTVSFTELYSALSTGVVDGAEQPTPNYRSNAFPEVAPYLLLDATTAGGVSVGALFMAGYLPGALLAIALMAGPYILAVRRNYPKGEKFSLATFGKQLGKSIWALLAVLIVVIGVVGGVFTATESAAIAVIYSLFVSVFVYKGLNWKGVWQSLEKCVDTLAIVLISFIPQISLWLPQLTKAL